MNKTLLIITALILFLLLSGRGKKLFKMNTEKTTPSDNNFNAEDARKGIEKVKQIYGDEIAKKVERIFRVETSHFTSEQYRRTGTAGLTLGKWKGLPELPTISGIGKVNKSGETSSSTVYYVWNPVEFALYLAKFIKRHNGNEGRYYSTNAQKQGEYITTLNTVKTHFV